MTLITDTLFCSFFSLWARRGNIRRLEPASVPLWDGFVVLSIMTAFWIRDYALGWGISWVVTASFFLLARHIYGRFLQGEIQTVIFFSLAFLHTPALTIYSFLPFLFVLFFLYTLFLASRRISFSLVIFHASIRTLFLPCSFQNLVRPDSHVPRYRTRWSKSPLVKPWFLRLFFLNQAKAQSQTGVR